MTPESIKGKRITIYGATSKIGSITARKAIDQGAEVVAFVRNLAKAEPLKQAGAEIVVGDITNPEDVMKAVDGRAIDVTINFAAVFNLSSDTSSSRAVNVNGEEYVLNANEQFYVPRHIFISTIGTQMEGPNAYRDSKLEAESLVKNSKVQEWLILRFADVIGTEDPNDLWNNPYVTKKVLGKRIGLAKIPSKKNAPFPYLGIDTATEATLKAITARPNQTITILDGFDTVKGYLTAMANVNNIDFKLALPHSVMVPSLVVANKTAESVGKHFPITPGAAKIVTSMPKLENKVMQNELGIKPQTFEEVIYKARERLKK